MKNFLPAFSLQSWRRDYQSREARAALPATRGTSGPASIKRLVSFAALAAAAVFFTGCATDAKLTPASAAAPAAFKEAPVTGSPATSALLPVEWWRVFNDPELNALQTQVVSANSDFQRASWRLEEARALARLSEAELRPHVSLENGFTRAGGGDKASTREHRLEAKLDYELDLWGRQRHAANATRADARAISLDADSVWLSLTAEAARNYYQIRSLDTEKQLIEATLALRRDTVRLQETRNQAGLINEVDVTRARTELANVEAELHAIDRSRARLEHALAVLCGLPPAEFKFAAYPNTDALPDIPAGLPSLLLRRRADILAAGERLNADAARVSVAKADFFPRISLTGSAGFASADLNSLLKADSSVWSFGPSVHVPLLDGGQNRANLAAARARYEQSLAAWRGTVLNAFREVEDALSDLRTLHDQGQAVVRAANSARETAALAQARYDRGLTSYLDVVDAQRAALQAERLEVQLRGEHALSTILLAKALGGGWNAETTVASK